ncbi:hypothetical protein GOBAR_AA17765 [Gossypium barbadense]|uniref:Myb/SANT-like domain-containing protein n=1 Tax=Gossypium barbadense TaxID=3634 RepID=A0A2P5XHX6_GOSBA|nr:hypothetical protein GOBAR_AA17765 [Gossypium barbadense]
MLGFSQSSASSQNSRGTKKKWVLEEDVVLVACMVDLYNVETYNVDTGFNASNLNELEIMLEKVLPHAMLKVKPNLESRIRILKMDWATVYNLLSGKDNSDFGWDEHSQMVIAKDAMWNSYITTQLQPLKPNQDGSTSLKKKKMIYDGSEQIFTSITDAAIFFGENIRNVGLELSKSISSEKVIQESAQKIYPALCEVEGLTEDKRYHALSKTPNHPMQILIFFSLPSSVRLEWVKRYLSNH